MDLIRSGKAPEVIRRKGAEGGLPLAAEDRIEIVTYLADGPESSLREKAMETFRRWDREEIRRVMAAPGTAPSVLRFAARQVLAGHEELREALLRNPSLPDEVHHLLDSNFAFGSAESEGAGRPPGPLQPAPLAPPSLPETGIGSNESELEPAARAELDKAGVELLAKLAAGIHLEDIETPPEATKRDDELTQQERETLIEKVARMTVVEKIKAALTGNLETRSLLIRDSNKIISRAVLQSPKVSETEAEGYAAAKNVSEEVLRLIALTRRFMKNYVVMRALVNNPRVPLDVTMPLVVRLNAKDLKGLSLNRNVPEVLRSMAVKIIRQKEEASRPKQFGKF